MCGNGATVVHILIACRVHDKDIVHSGTEVDDLGYYVQDDFVDSSSGLRSERKYSEAMDVASYS